MELAGSGVIRARPETVAQARIDPEHLAAVRPACRTRRANGPAGTLVTDRIRSELRLRAAPAPVGCRLHWEGDLTAGGLAGRLLSGKQDAVQDRVLAMFRALKARIESAEAAPAPGAA